jgi:hypothetical protein
MNHKLVSAFVLFLAFAVLLSGCNAVPTVAPTTQPYLGTVEGVTLKSVRPVYEIVGEKQAPLATVSPDGTRIAWIQSSGKGKDRVGQVCLFAFANAAKKCYNISTDVFKGYPYQLQWSPDSASIVFTENPIQQGYESDIWIFNTTDGSFTNLTDDNVTGGWTGVPFGTYALDILPSWNAVDGKIYFWRIVPQGNITANTGIFRILPTGGQPEQVYDLTTAMPQQIPVFNDQTYFLDGFSAVSPDGKKLASLVSQYSETPMSTSATSLWLFDLVDTKAAPKQLLAPDAWGAALPEWQANQGNPAQPVGLTWKGDSNSVVVMAVSASNATPFSLFYDVDVASGTSTPVVDFSQVATSEDYFAPAPGSDIPWRYYSPWTASLSSKNDKLLMFSNLGSTAGLMVSALPSNGKLPGVAGAASTNLSGTVPQSSRSKDGKVLMYGLMFTTTED